MVEEDFRLDTVPHVFGRDRKAVVKNKQNRLFRESKYAQSILQGREPGGRRDDQMLFTSIISPELLDPWIAQLNRHKVPIVGIYSVPILSGELLSPLSITDDNVLLVSIESRSGLRQSFFQDQQLKVSRLAPMQRLDVTRAASYILQEVERLRRYLNSLRLLTRGLSLDVYLISHGAMLLDLERQAKDSITTRFHLLDTAEIAEQLGVQETEHSPYMDSILATALARSRAPNFYGTAEDTRYARYRQAGVAMSTVGALALVAGVGWSGLKFAEGLIKRQDIGTIGKQADFYEGRFQLGRERLPDLPADGQQMQRTVDAVKVIESYRESPRTMLAAISEGFELFPEFKLEGIDWRVSSSANAEALSRNPSSARGRAGNVNAEPSKSYFQIARVRGSIQTFAGDYRTAIDAVNRFADTLAGVNDIETVNILRMPLDLSSRQRLAGVATSAIEGAAQFEVQVVLRTKGE